MAGGVAAPLNGEWDAAMRRCGWFGAKVAEQQ